MPTQAKSNLKDIIASRVTTMNTETALVPAPTSEYVALTTNALDIINENLKNQPLSHQLFDTVKAPTGGTIVFTVPGLSGDEIQKELTGIILDYATPRAYWDTPDPVEGVPPVCYSRDSLTSFEGNSCSHCVHNQFGSRNGDSQAKACKESVELYLLRPDTIMPLIVRVPATSKGLFQRYLMRLVGKMIPVCGVITRITLDKSTSRNGQPYAQFSFEAVNLLKPDEAANARAFGQKFMEILNTADEPEIVKEVMPPDIWENIEAFYSSGRYKLVNKYIRKVLEKEDIPCLKQYLDDLDKFQNHEGHVITTHKKLLTLDEKTLSKYDVVLIDEDIILKSIIPDKRDINITDLKKLLKKLPPNSRLGKKIKQVFEKIKTETFFKLPQIDEYEEDDEDDTGTSNTIDIPAFCLATHFCYRQASDEPNLKKDCISFFKPVEFPNRKIVIASATVDETICRYYFGANRVKFCECKKAKYAGKITQYADKSYSRACIAEHPGIIDIIMKWTGDEYLITFKKHTKDGNLYLCKTEGIDTLKGQHITIIGTPHSPEFIYKLFAFSLGLDFDENAELKSQIVTTQKFKFRFNTYSDDVLRSVQFWILSSELSQAIGRARILRFKEGAVNLFSNFPVDEQAIFKEPEYDKKDEAATPSLQQ